MTGPAADLALARMIREACALAEGFCPRCGARLTPVAEELAGWCEVCDLYHHVTYAGGEVQSVGATVGWWARESGLRSLGMLDP